MSAAFSEDGTGGRFRSRRLLILPLIVFLGLAVLFLVRIGGDPSRVPSTLIGRPAPDFALPALEGLTVPGLSSADLQGQVTLVNIWASWCLPCHQEHPFLMALAADPRIRVVGINYKDEAENARRFLGRFGNPFAAIGTDGSGRTAIDWGVYGVPETFVVGRDGRVLHKLVGPITADNLERVLKPRIEAALASPS
jgi:cytochrome c biogenesis protein CcmG/thiol:disulfide interchange protein DsbE